MGLSPYYDVSDEDFLAQLDKNTILKVVAGSTSRGLALTESNSTLTKSDLDLRSIVILPKDYDFRLNKPFESLSLPYEDHVFYTLKKAFALGLKQDPTFLGYLAVEDKYLVKTSVWGDKLRQQQQIFYSADCYKSFKGFAKSILIQLQRQLGIFSGEVRKSSLNDNITDLLADFVLKEGASFRLSSIETLPEGKYSLDLTIEGTFGLRELTQQCKVLTERLDAYNNKYANRENLTIDKLNKQGMYLILTLVMGAELLETGKLIVERNFDRKLLLDLRNGKYSWDAIFSLAKDLEARLEYAHLHTVLPPTSNYAKISQLYAELMTDFHYGR